MKIPSKIFLLFMIVLLSIYSKNAFTQAFTGKILKVTYDVSLNPTINLNLKNNSSSTVSNVYLTVLFTEKNSDPNDYTAQSKQVAKMITINILPKSEKTTSISVVAPNTTIFEYQGIRLDRVRYTDGSVKTF